MIYSKKKGSSTSAFSQKKEKKKIPLHFNLIRIVSKQFFCTNYHLKNSKISVADKFNMHNRHEFEFKEINLLKLSKRGNEEKNQCLFNKPNNNDDKKSRM